MNTRLLRAVLCAVGISAFVSAQEAPPRLCPPIDPAALLRQPGAGFMAFRDPVTGKLRQPTAAEAAALAARQRPAAPERAPVFEIVTHPDGMRSADLRGAFTAATVAVKSPDGTITIRCVPAGERAKSPAPDVAAAK